ncbi:GIY-YIG nuclease family protein [Vibrio sp. RE86]|uniref:GIY-YIG nuclease family protein n=1 Tax=Vibrio sp. RE86 TaxID=2607605 RepID=UPI001493BA7E|nr:GIY-YIG nuclease family protein [Vibrio sp. RE86]NOH81060.1 GIY-YIG nuclease family protein [Vibrio sp. RE86]
MSSDKTKAHSEWYVYLIRMRNNALYCGITTDVERRFSEHSCGKGAKALKGKGPLSLAWFGSAGSSRSSASKIEYHLKRLDKKQKEKLVLGHYQLSDLVDKQLFD